MENSAGKMRVWVAMSGGVDSSTAAAILVEQGYHVEGVFMDLWDCRLFPSRGRATCCSPRDQGDARRVAEHLGVPLHVVDLQDDFRERIVEDFVREYLAGRTPNPCIRCNQWIKYDRLLEMARRQGADILATGHYAKKGWDPQEGTFRLMKGKDAEKDQSYFLFPLQQTQLSRILWPVGGLSKEEVRAQAKRKGLPVARKAESQEICFIPDQDYRAFLETYLPSEDLQPGEIVDIDGRSLGMHMGIHGFTVGQRRGLGIPWREPLYVLKILPNERKVVVGPRKYLTARALEAEGASWVAGEPPSHALRTMARIRYRHREAPAHVEVIENGRIRVLFDEPQPAITPGQAVVLYRGEEVLGGAWIREVRDAP